MAVISNLPKGLISLFGIRDMGEVPREISAVIAPTFDVTEFLLTNREALLPTTSSFALTGFLALATVPPGEMWRVHGYSVQCYDLSGGTTATFRTAYTEQSGAVIGLGQAISVAAPSDNRLAMTQSPFWAVPGARLGLWVETIAGGGSIAAQAAAIISRLRV